MVSSLIEYFDTDGDRKDLYLSFDKKEIELLFASSNEETLEIRTVGSPLSLQPYLEANSSRLIVISGKNVSLVNFFN